MRQKLNGFIQIPAQICPNTLPELKHSDLGIRTQQIQAGVDTEKLYFFPKEPFLQMVSSPSIPFLLLACPAIQFDFKARINQLFFYFKDLYFPPLINRINAMVKKRSLDILDEEFVHLFTPTARLPSRILGALL